MIGHNSGAVLLDAVGLFATLRRACDAAGGQKAWAEAHGIAPQHVNDVLAARREVSDRILAALGLARVVRYAPARIAPARPARLTPAERQAMRAETHETHRGTA